MPQYEFGEGVTTFMSIGFNFKGLLEYCCQLCQNMHGNAYHPSSIKEIEKQFMMPTQLQEGQFININEVEK